VTERGGEDSDVVELDIGRRVLHIEQPRDLSAMAQKSVVEHSTEPFWAYLWPSARALSMFIGTRDDLEGKRVLDLGCGLGAVGIACAAMGARVVVADLLCEAISLAERNARRNELEVEARVVDWNHPPDDLGTFDRIVAADVLYGDGMLAAIIRFLRAHLKEDGVAYIADPMRVVPAGLTGAARFRGLDTTTRVLIEGATMTGGVTLFEIRHRKRR
jgi:predicted nicotinamide N-methyase